MKKLVAFLTKEKKLRMNGKMITLTFFQLYTVYIKKLGQFFFHAYSLTCLNKDTSVLLKNVSIKNKLSIKIMVLNSFKIECIAYSFKCVVIMNERISDYSNTSKHNNCLNLICVLNI